MVINSVKYKITNLPRVYLACVLLEYVERYNVLGMIIHIQNDECDITRQLRSLLLRTNILMRTFSKCSFDVNLSPVSVIVLIYTVHIYGTSIAYKNAT